MLKILLLIHFNLPFYAQVDVINALPSRLKTDMFPYTTEARIVPKCEMAVNGTRVIIFIAF